MKTPADPTLDWNTFRWENFEVMTLQVMESHIPGLVLDLYLERGSAQEGIDLIQRSRTDGTELTVQCKKEKKLAVTDIDLLVQKFLQDEKSKTSTDFYLVTVANLRSKDLNRTLEKWKKTLRHKNIGFAWWDKKWLDIHLQSRYSIVERYFGSIQATSFCNSETLSRALPFDPPRHPIPRKMGRITRAKTIYEAFWLRPEDQAVSLVDVLLADRLNTHRFCLLADPYQGKTTYLQQCAWELSRSGKHVCPVYLDIKEANVQSIRDMLERYRGWDSVGFKDIVLFIDGLDEAPANEVVRLAKFVHDFAVAYPSISMVVSCRTLFYNHYSLETTLKGFPTFLLLGLDQGGIERYVGLELGDSAGDFLTLVKKRQLQHWLYHPFYLVRLIEYFDQDQHHTLPDSKLDAVNYFIDQAYKKAQLRLTANGTRLHSQSHHFRHAIKKLAIAMQLMRVNALIDDDFQPLFTPDESALLQGNGLVSIRDRYWTFTNSFFQEHLAADYLAGCPLEDILRLMSAGDSTKKIQIRWIQTAASLLSLLPKGSPKYAGLLAYIKTDSIELVFQTEPTLHDPKGKMDLLGELMAYLTVHNMWPMLTDPEEVGLFLSGTSEAIPYLIDRMTDVTAPTHIRRVAAQALGGMTDLTGWEQDILTAVHDRVGKAETDLEAADLIRLLANHRFGNEEDIEKVIASKHFEANHFFRDAMYKWIMALGLTRRFWPYGIQGIQVLAKQNQSGSNMGSKTMLDSFLLSIEHRYQLYRLFDAMNDGSWLELYRHELNKKDGFLAQVLSKCASLYKKDDRTIGAMIHFMRGAGRRYLCQYPELFGDFFAHTHCQLQLVLGLREDIFGDRNAEFGRLATPETFDFLLSEFWEEKHDASRLRSLYAGMEPEEKFNGSFRDLAYGLTRDEAFAPYDPSEALQMQTADRKRREMDVRCIQSIPSFRKAIRALFRLHGKEKITALELHMGHHSDVKGIHSLFTTRFIDSHCYGAGNTVLLRDCLLTLKDIDKFEFFRASQILDYPYKDERIETGLTPIVQEYYYKHLPTSQFANAWSDKYGHWKVAENEELIARIFGKYQFSTETQYLTELLWLDNGGMQDDSRRSFQQNDLLRDKVLLQIGRNERKLRQAIVAHLKTGIESRAVLMTHLDLCQKLHIVEARPLVFQLLTAGGLTDEDKTKASSVYLSLQGDKKSLLPLLDTTHGDESFWLFLLQLLAEDIPETVTAHAISFLHSATTYSFHEMKLAYLLMKLGQVAGLHFLLEVLKGSRQGGTILHDGQSVMGLDTGTALLQLKEVMHFAVDPRYRNIRSPDNPKGVIMDWLGALAAKGETDLHLVLQFLQQTAEEWKNAFPEGASNLQWHANGLLERFRGNQSGALTMSEVTRFLDQTQAYSQAQRATSPASG